MTYKRYIFLKKITAKTKTKKNKKWCRVDFSFRPNAHYYGLLFKQNDNFLQGAMDKMSSYYLFFKNFAHA